MKRRVIGSYSNQEETTSEINRLIEEGYTREAITLYTSPTHSNQFRSSQDADREPENVREDIEEVIDQDDIERKERDQGREEVGGKGISQESLDEDGREGIGRESNEDIDRIAREEEESNEYEDHADRIEEDDNRSFMDDLADMFTLDVYDYQDESKNPNYNPEEDVLYPHREDIAKGNSVIVVDNYRGPMI